MDFVDLKVNINVDFGTMTREQANEFISFFMDHLLNSKQVTNEDIFNKLDLDKRPFYVTTISQPKKENDNLIQNAEINFVC